MTLPTILVEKSRGLGGGMQKSLERVGKEEAFQAEGRTDANVTKYGKAQLAGSSVHFHSGWEGRWEPARSGR